MKNFRFCIASDALRVSLCLRYLYIAATLWNYIQASLSLICLSHHNCTSIVDKVGCLVYLAAIILGCPESSFLKVDLSGSVKKKGDFRFWISGDAWRVSLCFRSLYIESILWNYIQASSVSLWLYCC